MSVTIHELAVYEHEIRGHEIPEDSFPGSFYFDVDLSIMGGCEGCGANLNALNAYPSRAGFWRCHDCIDGLGYDDVIDAHRDIFGEA